MNILKITSKITSVKTKCFIGMFGDSFTIWQKFTSHEGSVFAEVTFENGFKFVDWD